MPKIWILSWLGPCLHASRVVDGIPSLARTMRRSPHSRICCSPGFRCRLWSALLTYPHTTPCLKLRRTSLSHTLTLSSLTHSAALDMHSQQVTVIKGYCHTSVHDIAVGVALQKENAGICRQQHLANCVIVANWCTGEQWILHLKVRPVMTGKFSR